MTGASFGRLHKYQLFYCDFPTCKIFIRTAHSKTQLGIMNWQGAHGATFFWLLNLIGSSSARISVHKIDNFALEKQTPLDSVRSICPIQVEANTFCSCIQ